jgi:parallel beta-helix repeat protein
MYLYKDSNSKIIGSTVTGNSKGITFRECSGSRIENNNDIRSNTYGIYFTQSDGNWIEDHNDIISNTYGITLTSSSDNTIIDNEVDGGKRGIYLESSPGTTITNNDVTRNSEYGIRLKSSSSNTITNNDVIGSGQRGIYLESSPDNTIIGNTVTQKSIFGIYIGSSKHNELKNNIITKSLTARAQGLWISGSSIDHYKQDIATSNKVNGKPIQYFTSPYKSCPDNEILNYGNAYSQVAFVGCTNITLTHTKVIDSILLAYTDDTSIKHCNVSQARYGIYSYESDNNNVTGTTVTENKYGITLRSSSNNLIYNNYFKNNRNADDDGRNDWNTTYQEGENIYGGRYLGGNYWSDYVGNDTGEGPYYPYTEIGDGIGDENYPYSKYISQGGDYLPLATPGDNEPPNTTIQPNGHPWTNEDVDFNLTCYDEISDCYKTYYIIIENTESVDDCPTQNPPEYTEYMNCTPTCFLTVNCSDDSVCNKSVCFFSVDNVGNNETTNISNPFLIDKAKPSIKIIRPVPGVLRGDSTLEYNITDSGSGLEECKLYTKSASETGWVDRGSITCGESETTISVGKDPSNDCYDRGWATCGVMISANDKAGNQNDLIIYYSTDWAVLPMVNLTAHNITISLGQSELVRAKVLSPCVTQHDTINLSLEFYENAMFENNERNMEVLLNPNETKYISVKVYSSKLGNYHLELEAVSSLDEFCYPCTGIGDNCVEASDQLGITIISPAGFSGLSVLGIVLLIILAGMIWVWVDRK